MSAQVLLHSLLLLLLMLLPAWILAGSCKNTSPATDPCNLTSILSGGSCAEYYQVNANLSDQYIVSPNYPKPYDHQTVCRWVVSACSCFNPSEPDLEYRVELEMMDYEMQDSASCTRDFVEVRDGKRQWDYSLARYCGSPGQSCSTVSRNLTVSSLRHLLITFLSDQPLNEVDQWAKYKGFRMRYRCLAYKPPIPLPLVMGPANYVLICLSCVLFAALLGAVVGLADRERRRHLKLL